MGTVGKHGADQSAGNARGMRSVDFGEAAGADTRNVQETAFYHMLVDAAEAGDDLMFNPKPIFRPDEKHPVADALDTDRKLVDSLLHGR